jgi:hypothetical protein
MTDLRDAAQQALKSLRGYRRELGCQQPCDAERALEAALTEEALQRLTDANQEIEAALEQPEHGVTLKPVFYAPRRLSNEEVMAVIGPFREPEQESKFTLSCGCPSQHGGVPAYWERDGSTAFGMICERHWHEYGARSEA